MLLSYFIKRFGGKNTIMIGLIFEMLQLICYGLGSNPWVVWSAGILAAGSTISKLIFLGKCIKLLTC